MVVPAVCVDSKDARRLVQIMRTHRQVMADPEGMVWSCSCGRWHGGSFDVHRLADAIEQHAADVFDNG